MMKEKRGIVNQQNAGLFLFVTPFLAFIGPHSRKYCGYALCSPVPYLLLAALPLAVFASPQPLEQIKKAKASCRAAWAMLKWIWPAAARWPPGAPMNAFR
jgi:hypothetical protein